MSLTIRRALDNVPLVGVSVRAVALYHGFDEEISSQIELATVEAVTNSVKHARPEDGNIVEVQVWCRPDDLLVQVLDDGLPFDPISDPSLPEELSESGYGLFLVHAIADHVEWDRHNDRNRLSFRKNLVQKEEE